VAFHGVCGSPLIVGNLVVVSPTGKSSGSLAAYDRLTGKPAWCTGSNEASYATPMLASVAGVEQILNYDEHGLTAHNPANGAVLWHFEWNSHEPICSQPIANAGAPDQVLLTVGYGRGSALLKVSCGTNGTWAAEPVWESKTMKTKFTTAVADGGYVYGLDDGIMQCIDLKTGRQKWKGGRYEHGQILLAGDLIIVQTEPGPVVLIEANPQHLTELGTIQALSSKTWNCPTLAGKYLLVRNDREAVCYEVALDNR
jgi:outer membrane protein assembly factor BamB